MDPEKARQFLRECAQTLAEDEARPAAAAGVLCRPLRPMVCVYWPGVPAAGRETAERTLQALWPADAAKLTENAKAVQALQQAAADTNAAALAEAAAAAALPMRDVRCSGYAKKNELLECHFLNMAGETDGGGAAAGMSNEAFQKAVDCIAAAAVGRNDCYSLVFLMASEHLPADRDCCRTRLQYAAQALAGGSFALVCLSNTLHTGGVLLQSEEEAENYRVAADAAALCNSQPDTGLLEALLGEQNGRRLTTFSYRLLAKPSRRMARVLLYSLLAKYEECAAARCRANFPQGVFSPEMFRAKLQDDGHGGHSGIPCLEKAFAGLLPQLPAAEDLAGLPNGRAVRALHAAALPGPAQKAGGGAGPAVDVVRSACKADFRSVDAASGGFFGAFAQEHFVRAARRAAADPALQAAVRQEFRAALCARFGYRDMLEFFPQASAELLAPIAPAAPQSAGDTALDGALREAVLQAKEAFYEALRPALAGELRQLADDAGPFAGLLHDYAEYLRAVPEPGSVNVQPVDEYYANAMQNSLSGLSEAEVLGLLPVCTDDAPLLAALRRAFMRFADGVRENGERIFRRSFEKELAARVLHNQDGRPASDLILERIGDAALEMEYRLSCAGDAEQARSFCILNAEADFAGQLDSRLGEKIKVTGTDCAERLICFRFSAARLV